MIRKAGFAFPLTLFFCGAALVVAAGCTHPNIDNEKSAPPSSPPISSPKHDTPTNRLAEGLQSVDASRAHTASSTAATLCPTFRDVHDSVGVEFVYQNGRDARALMVQSTGGGAAWLDYDLNGCLDLIFPQGGNPTDVDNPAQPNDVLYRQLPSGKFEVTSEPAGIDDRRFGQGAAAADFNNDGFPDIYITNVGRNRLYLNCGDGTFLDIAETAGVEQPAWSSSAAWGDVDGDGNLDLFVCNYLDYDPFHPVACTRDDGAPAICHPENLAPVPNQLLLSRGDGTFRLPSPAYWKDEAGSKSLGVVIADFTQDSLPDIYVANDTTANFLYVNYASKGLREEAVARGCALNSIGEFQASMGVAVGDYDHNGALDIYCTHFTDDSNTLYTNLGSGNFDDRTRITGLHEPTLSLLGFGTVMEDFNADGSEELFIANGHIDDWRDRGEAWRMPAQLFAFAHGRWKTCSDFAGPYFQEHHLGRTVAVGDFNRDRRPDVLVVHQNEAAALLENISQHSPGLVLTLIGTVSNRSAIGTEVRVRQGTWERTKQLVGGSSYAASHEPKLWFAVPNSKSPCQVWVRWPRGSEQSITLSPGASWRITEGGEPLQEGDDSDV